MTNIILDISANTTKNDNKYAKLMIDNIKEIDNGKHNITFKPQLFIKAGDNIPMTHEHFDYIYNYCVSSGYRCTASVFDKPSLEFLLGYDVPFIKIACNKDLRYLIGEIPRKIEVYHSVDKPLAKPSVQLACVSKYPAKIEEYKQLLSEICNPEYNSYFFAINGISDHTSDLELFNKYHTDFPIFEMHYALEDSTGLDVEAKVCKTPKMLKEVL